MKRVFLIGAKNTALTATLVVFLAAPFAPLTAQAQVGGIPDFPTTVPAGSTGAVAGSCGPGTTFSSQTGGCVSLPGAQGGAAANAAAAQNPSGSSSGSNFGCGLSPSTWDLCITNIVYVFTVGIGGGFAYVAAYFFDWAIALSLNSGSYALDFVSQGWTMARDLANMAFLFILLYIAFKIMFEAETTQTIQMLVAVIVVALLVNFSFFFTRLAIDAGNILSIQFYNAIQAPSIASTAASQQPGVSGALSNSANASAFANAIGSGGNSKDLTFSIMGMLNLQGLFNTQSFQNWYTKQNGTQGFMVVLITLTFLYIAAGIMFWLLTVAFVTNGIKFLFRIVVLWFLIIASPLAFVARAVPRFEGYYHEWQEALIKHAFYPAAFMFIFLILTNFSNQMGQNNALINGLYQGLNSSNSATPLAAIGYAAANVFIRLGFVIAMLYIGMEASKRIGVMGARIANHAGEWVGGRMTTAFRKTGGAIGAGVPAWAGRNTIGFLGDKYAKSNVGRDLAARGGVLGRTVWRGAAAVGRQSFDTRGGLTALGVKESLVGKPGGEGGYTAKFDARIKAREEEAKKLKPSENKLAQAQAKVLRDLSPADKQELADLANTYAEQKEAFESGAADRNDVKTAKKAFDAKIKSLGIIDKSREIAGYKNDKKYASSIETKNWRNLWGAGQGTPGWIWAADKESALQIRGAKTDAERLKNVLANLGVTPTAPPPAPPLAATPPPASPPAATPRPASPPPIPPAPGGMPFPPRP